MKTRGFLKVMSTFLLALSILTGMVFVADAANGDLTVTVEAQVPAVAYGKTVEVQVRIDENPGFLGLNFDVKWDGAVLEFVSADKTGADFDKVEANSQTQFNKVVLTVGDPLLGIMYPDSAQQYKDTGKVARLTFKVKEGVTADTTTQITVERASYVKVGGESSDAVIANSQQLDVFAANHQHIFRNGVCVICGGKQNDGRITGVSLRPGSAGLYFKGEFDMEKASVARYGMAVSLSVKQPVADDSRADCLYTVGEESVLIYDILGGAKTGKDTIYVRPYVLLKDGTYVYGNTLATSLKAVVESLDAKLFDGLPAAQQTALADMYRKHSAAMQNWQIPKIKAFA